VRSRRRGGLGGLGGWMLISCWMPWVKDCRDCIIASGNGFIVFGKGVMMDGMDSVLDSVCTRILIDTSKSRNCSSCHDW
jgi:hypothetical protein